MSDKMHPIPFNQLLHWIITEYMNQNSIFGIPSSKFQSVKGDHTVKVFGHQLENPIGPAAGPHTQLAQNIISAYLVGGRFFELKTVQQLDNLKIDKPCIDAADEGYNVEWSQELSLDESYSEYLKAWILIDFLKDLLGLSNNEHGFIFNMSVGYDLEGIKTERMDRFIEELKDASKSELFAKYKSILINEFQSKLKSKELRDKLNISDGRIDKIIQNICDISPKVSNSLTLSTMHGCPPQEIEAIAKYLIEEKHLHTYVKLNPTLLGYEYVKDTLHGLGYKYIDLDESSFNHDLQYKDAIAILNRMRSFAFAHNKIFGIKLSNTLGVKNRTHTFPGNDMYMSGRSLFPLTINLAYKLATDFNGELNISFSGGASVLNVSKILETGIKPISFATDLLKPGGYLRLAQISEKVLNIKEEFLSSDKLDLVKLKTLAESSLTDKTYSKEKREIKSIKIPQSLPLFDCYIAPCQEACPIHQDVAAYIRLIELKKYEEAYELIVSKNPLPYITGYICDHQCMYHCTRWDYDEPVLIRDLKKEAAEKGYQAYIENFNSEFLRKKNNTHVAIIGAGPSGLSAGYFLAKAGFDVTIFEKEMNAGGIIKNVLPKFRLPEEAIRKDIEFIEKHGIKFVFGFNPNFSVDKLKREGYKYIYIAIGAEHSNKIQITGDDENIFDVIEFLKDFHNAQQFDLGKNVAVIGGGNSAMDSARTAKRYEGVENVCLIYRRTKEQMPADREEFITALAEGVEYKELLLPVKFSNNILKCKKMKLGEMGQDGRASVVPIENEFEEIKVNSIISAIGEHVDIDALVRNNISVEKNKIVVNGTNETNLENIFIGGDALRGPSTVVESIADGKRTADAIINKENCTQSIPSSQSPFNADKQLIEEFNKRKGEIVNQHNADYHLEASRCLGCNFICNKCVEVCPNRANVLIDTSALSESFNDKYQIIHIDDLCNECGNCETFCPYQSAPYKQKLTLFTNENDFTESANNGFILRSENDKITATGRYNGLTKKLIIDDDQLNIHVSNGLNEFDKICQLINIIRKDYSYLLFMNK